MKDFKRIRFEQRMAKEREKTAKAERKAKAERAAADAKKAIEELKARGKPPVRASKYTRSSFKCVDPPRLDANGIFYFDNYHPYIRGSNPNHKGYSARILTLKGHTKGYRVAMEFFTDLLANAFTDDCAIAVVPSHDPGKTESGIRQLASRIASSGSRMDATACLVRHTKIPKLSTQKPGGRRDIGLHLGSIRTSDDEVPVNRQVFVLDDISTSGNSLLACRKLLVKAGVRKVVLCALGKTVPRTHKEIL